MSRFEILMKPTAMSRKAGVARRPEYLIELEADDKNAAAIAARQSADSEGFKGYAITHIKEK